ncbi:MAG: hypothetical protein PF569_05645 [Candidatus Woesearchaeota archaeon]|jgi:hypothetical protein|nr:hypothetical protein [Candidatus Woesearchaeota archaeon]
MSEHNYFDKHFDYGSFLPLFLFILGIYTLYLFLIEDFASGVMVMVISFAVYVLNNILINFYGFTTVFNEYLEDIAVYLVFGLTTIVFGLLFYQGDLLVLVVLFFYAISLVLNLARNWILKLKNSMGWPISLNGIFFPIVFYIYRFYLGNPGDSIFLIFYIAVTLMAISHHNFLGYKEDTKEKIKVVDVLPSRNKKSKDKVDELGKIWNKKKVI